MQTLKGSAAETFANTCIGWIVNYSANLFVLPYFGFTSITPAKAFGIGVVFTAISLVRSFVLRRVFNKINWGNSETKV
jgi:hypothetical protein